MSESTADCANIAVPFERKIRHQLRACYQAGLKVDPKTSGTANVVLDLDINGKIVKVKIADNHGLSKSVTTCLVDTVRSTGAEWSACGSKTLTFPVKFETPKP